ncbi:protein phosphatase 1 regulatory subunit 16A [Ostrinia furnacalis]|uniref:protein phosphatase 1 regulatory subunit 16A n=1 Tax=Ostrinia furnacalis TaxID=93504 RepID=UPI001039EB46|nr:protein phosphatase 1 regulatory subunit 16A [Ostrinia furnacalis]
MEHSDLVAEMAQVEHLTTQERLHLARRRRMQQLKLWQQREKEWARSRGKREKSNKRNIFFNDSVMLLEAAARNDIEEVRRLLARGVTPDATNEDGLTALHQCCIDNNEAMMRLLLDNGANVNAEDSEKWTPLHAAATCGNLNLVRILIQRGANLLAVNGDGNMPYDICEEERTLDAIESEMAARGVTQRLIDETRAATEMRMLMDVAELVKEGMDLDEPRDNQGATLLHIASANGYTKVVEFLLEHRASTDVVDHDVWQPVHAAACWGHLEVLELLVQYGADLNVRNKHDETPADICEEGEMRARIVRLAAEQEERRRRALHAAGERATTARRSSSTASASSLTSEVPLALVPDVGLRRRALHAAGERATTARRSSSTASASRSVSVLFFQRILMWLSDDEVDCAMTSQTMSLDIMFLTHDNLRRLRKEPQVLGLRYRGLSNGMENDQNTANQMQPNDLTHKRLSTSSTTSNQSYDSNVEYAVPKHSYNQRARNSDVDGNDLPYPPKISNPLFGVNAASHYAPGSHAAPEHETKHYEKSLPNGVRKAPEGQDNDAFKSEDSLDGRKEVIVSPNQIAITEGGTATYTTDNNGKINVHVTVMINAGTLADLKKQRAQIRTNGSPVENSLNSTNNHSINSIPEVTKDMPVQLNPLTLSPSSGTVPRFSGNTSDVVGDTRSHRCCIIM